MKRKNLLVAFCLTAVFLLTGNASWAQNEAVAYQTGFESSEGFTANTSYNNTEVAYSGNTGQQWGTYYGTPSTTGAITDAQSMQMRWYTASPSSYGYTFTNFDLANVTKVVFKAKNTNGINVICSYSTDGGTTFIGNETITLTTEAVEYTYNISATGEFANVRVKFQLTYAEAPTATSRLIIDDVKIYTIAAADETAPAFTTDYPAVENVYPTSLDLLVNLNEPGTAYYTVVADGATAPTAAEVIAANHAIAVAAANTEYTANISDLTAETAYDIYVVAQDDEATPNVQAAPTKIDVTTLSATAKLLNLTAPLGGETFNAGIEATITWTSINCTDESIKIEVYAPFDGSSWSWNELDSYSQTNDGTETITIPSDAPYATTYKIRISLVSDATVNSVSGDFTVVPFVSIHDIQYTTAEDGASTMLGDTISTTGIVTAVKIYSETSSNFAIQNGTEQYNGVYVYGGNMSVALGDSVVVTGLVDEYNGLTEIKNALVTIVSSNNTVPAPIEVSTLAANEEGYEGMLVKVSNATYTNSKLNDGSGDLAKYGTFYNYSFVEGTTYDVIGIMLAYNGAQICPRQESDVTTVGGGSTDYTPIYNIQYTTAADGASPLAGQTVTTKGIVTAVNWNDQYNNGNVTIQDGTTPFNGLYVYRSTTQVSLGDSVLVTGSIVEYNGLTEVAQGSTVTIINSGNTLPTPIAVTTLAANEEGYEAMLVKVSNAAFDGSALNDGTGSLASHTTFYSFSFTSGSVYNVTGVMSCYNNAQICPRSADDIELISGGEVTYTPIYDIQYTTAADGASPLAGQSVTTKGIVTAVNWSDQYNNGNVTIQDGTTPFNGLYIYRCATQVALGDSVMVTGTLSEYNGLTEINQGATVTIINSGNTLPEPIVLTTAQVAEEGYESMLVKVQNATASVTESGTTVDDGTGSLTIYGTFYSYEFTDGTSYNVTGVVTCYTVAQLCPRSESDVTVASAIDDNQFAQFRAYPNPFTNQICFDGSNVNRVTVVSVIGQVVMDMNVTNGQTISTTDLPKGIYLVRFTNENGKSTVCKMIKR